MPTTMLLRLVVVPLRLVIVAEPFVVLPARLKVIDLLDCAWVGSCDSGTVLPLGADETVVAGEVLMPVLELVTTIPVTTQVLAVLATEVSCAGLLVVQVPVVVHVVGSVKGVLVFPLVGPTASELPVKVKVAFDDIVIDVPLTLLTVAPLGMPCPYMYIPG
jgi:hypothetical protein